MEEKAGINALRKNFQHFFLTFSRQTIYIFPLLSIIKFLLIEFKNCKKAKDFIISFSKYLLCFFYRKLLKLKNKNIEIYFHYDDNEDISLSISSLLFLFNVHSTLDKACEMRKYGEDRIGMHHEYASVLNTLLSISFRSEHFCILYVGINISRRNVL